MISDLSIIIFSTFIGSVPEDGMAGVSGSPEVEHGGLLRG